jgi:hypothetical protein
LFVVGIAKTVMIDQGGQFGQTLFQLLILLLLRINFTWVLVLSLVDLAVYNIYASVETNVDLRSYLSILLFVLAFAYSGCYRMQVGARVCNPRPVGGRSKGSFFLPTKCAHCRMLLF